MLSLPLLLHLGAFIVLSGGIVGSTVLHLLLQRAIVTSPAQLPGLARLGQVFGPLTGVGAMGMLLTGLFFLASRGWADVGQTWLTVKLTLFVVLWIVGFAFSRPAGQRLGQALSQGPAGAADVQRVMHRLSLYTGVQLAGLLAIVTLAVFGPR